MNTNTDKISASQPGLIQASPVKVQALKLGIDVHVDRYVVVRQIEQIEVHRQPQGGQDAESAVQGPGGRVASLTPQE